MTIPIKHEHEKPIIIDSTLVLPGQSKDVRMVVGRLPSDTKIHIEAKVFRSKNPGPTILIVGGIHGDEINGIQIVKESIEKSIYDQLTRGSVITIPLVNVFGFINFSRDVPDGKDVNRSFPGNKSGSLASRVAYVLTRKILPYVDLVIDNHTGGAFRYNYPQVRYYPKDPIATEVAHAFGAKYAIEKPFISKSLRKVAYDKNIPTVVFEGGESVRLNGFCINSGIKGILRSLHHLDMLDGTPPPLEEEQILCTKTLWLRAPYSGIFIWSIPSGNYVQHGDILGHISDPYANKNIAITAKRSGHLIGHNNASVVNQGDALFHLAYETQPLS